MSLFSGMKLTTSKKPAPSISAKVQDGSPTKKSVAAGGGTSDSRQSLGHQTGELQVKETDGTRSVAESVPIESKPEPLRLQETSEVKTEEDTTCSSGTMGEGISLFSFITETDKDNTQGQGKRDVQTSEENVSTNENLDLDPFSVDVPQSKHQISDATKLSLDLEGLDLSSVSLSPEEEISERTHLAVSKGNKCEIVEEENKKCVNSADEDEDYESTGQDDVVKENVADDVRWLDLDEDQEMGYSPITFDSDTAKAEEKTTGGQIDEHPAVDKEPQYDVELSRKEQLEVMQQMHAAQLRHIR